MKFIGILTESNAMSNRFKSLFILGISLCIGSANAQKKPLDHSVYDGWQNISGKALSADGQSLWFQIAPQEGDKLLYVKAANQAAELQIPRGENAAFTSDSQFVAALIKPFYTDLRAVKIKKKKEADLPKDSLAVVALSDWSITKIARVKSYKIPEKGGAKLAYLREKEPQETKADSLKTEATSAKKDDPKAKQKDKKAEPLPLVLLDLQSGKQLTVEAVVEYEFSKNGKYLALATQEVDQQVDSTKTAAKSGVYGVILIDTDTWEQTVVWEEKGSFSQLAFDDSAQRLAFIGTTSESKVEPKVYRLYSSFKKGKARVLAAEKTKGLPEKWSVSENSKPQFSQNGKRLFFGIAPLKTAQDTTIIAEDHAIVDVWHYKDDYLQTIQLKNLEKELKRSYLATIDLGAQPAVVPLGDTDIREVVWVNQGNADWVLGYSDTQGRLATQWTGVAARDYYEIDVRSGRAKLIVAGLNGTAFSSPLGKYLVYFNKDRGNWYSYDRQQSKHRLLNSGLAVAFADEEFDMPDQSPAYGIAEWTDRDETVLIKDRYDIWEFSLNGSKSPVCVTKGYGRDHRIRFELNKFDPEIRSVSRTAPLLLSAFDETTKEAGFYTTAVQATQQPQLLRMEPVFSNNALIKAKNADTYLYAKESFVQAPSLFVTADFNTVTPLIATNPQQSDYNWGTAELVHWTTATGKAATGVLYKPEDFDARKKYPMIVYFYEKLSDNLHRYEAPAPTPSRLNISYFVSNGYLVFTPDIRYETGYPGRSAEEYINSGVDFLEQNPWVDATKVGIQGQSWGGYQVAHLITRTTRYAAAWSGAPVVNMTSAYGGIRWSTGMNRQFQYEKTQSRIGANLWDAHDLYIENSPLFFMNRVETPVAIMHNDNDGAVPWYQGIEMFTALRRLGKPVWMLNYNGDEHNLMQRQNRKDIQIREQQFFDHYLKGAPMPVWMDSGVPAVLKGKTWGLELVD
ncbi:alpha/beta hydrolase family protein [Flavobacterium sp. JP2137]|uniref:alpha/beta hydrolase family protein n=1 Tax=Flavobacterium sp. JP2137 TaxID=3414510 RepID=UPI003D2F9D28